MDLLLSICIILALLLTVPLPEARVTPLRHVLLISNIRKSQTVRTELCRRFIVANCPVDLKVIYDAAQVLGRSSSHDHARQGSFRPRDWFRD